MLQECNSLILFCTLRFVEELIWDLSTSRLETASSERTVESRLLLLCGWGLWALSERKNALKILKGAILLIFNKYILLVPSCKFITKTLFWLVSIIVLLSKNERKETVFSPDYDERKLSLVHLKLKGSCFLLKTFPAQWETSKMCINLQFTTK